MNTENPTITIPLATLEKAVRRSTSRVIRSHRPYVTMGNTILEINSEKVAQEVFQCIRGCPEIIKHIDPPTK